MFFRRLFYRVIYGTIVFLSVFVMVGVGMLLKSKTHIYNAVITPTEFVSEIETTPFPVSVNAFTKKISEDPIIEQHFVDTLASAPNAKHHWWNKVAATFFKQSWYQNLASPVSRILVIWPGERKEEVIKHVGDVLDWDNANREEFAELIEKSDPIFSEGKYFPSQYVAHREATPTEIHQLISDNFEKEVLSRYTPQVVAQVPLEDALIIASLLEREASDFNNMREVSGVIWNRLFIDMPLQLDATLQYVRGSEPSEKKWWPNIEPKDKFIKSSYNTYQNSGLPPTPIANPSTEAIVAALNPVITDCLYYFHDDNGDYHCSNTYEGHVSKLRSMYGRGS